MSTHSLPLEWLPTAFHNNDDLQTLHIKSPTSELALTLLTSATLLPIVSRLSCLEFDSNKRIAQPYHSAEIVQLIRGMRLDSCVKVYHKVDCSVFDYSSDTLDNREATAQILRFWLNIAQQSSGRELKLCLIFSWDVKRNLENALAHLKSCDSYADVKIERVDKRMILQHNSAAIILSIIAWHDFESERKALRVW
uniref:Uncharacterized protein n=1 Tax=Plectus sambesii TaxID=2011161 RepID=A0A914XMR7_9BILA